MSTRAVVTGHTRGLGAAVAEQLLARSTAVLGVARGVNADLEERFGDRVRQTRLDLSDADALTVWLAGEELRAFLAGATTALLVNNAGLLEPVGPLEAQDPASVVQTVTVNVAAPLALAAAFVRASDATDRRVLHIGSGAGTNPYAGWSVYCATKAALDHHARASREDNSPALRIASVAPGVIDTDMQSQIRAVDASRFPDRDRFVRLKQEGRLRAPADAARELVDYFLSPQFGHEPVTDLRDR